MKTMLLKVWNFFLAFIKLVLRVATLHSHTNEIKKRNEMREDEDSQKGD